MANLGHFASGSSLALALTLGLWANPAAAQPAAPKPAPAPAADTETDIVITGSMIRGTPEDAAIPVHAVTLKELQNLGAPSTMDLVKTMTDSGAVRGEADRRGAGSSVGVQTVNLRQLGSNRTLALLNGRRLQDQSSVGVRFSNIAVIPGNAVGRVETLRDGGAVTYGSDAIGGVVNFITRHDFSGLQVRGNYRAIDGSDGDYDADALWGVSNDTGNVMIASQFQHRSTLDALDRDWAIKDYLQNNAALGWSSSGSPGSMTLQTSRDGSGAPTGTIVPGAAAGLTTYNRGNTAMLANDYLRQMNSSGTVRDPGCRTEIGAFPGFSVSALGATAIPTCYFSLNKTDKLVEETDTYTTYGEVNFRFGPGVKYHGEAGYYQLQAPNVINTPSESPASVPVRKITCTAVNTPLAACLGNGDVRYVSQGAYWVDGHNPAVADILSRLTSSGGNQTLSGAQQTAITTNGAITLTGWRPFGSGGLPLTGGNEVQRNQLDSIRMTHEFSGELPKFLGTDLQWKVAATGSHSVFTVEIRDILVDRLQAALNGFGGPNCTGTTAGANGCEWFNPFSSAIEKNVYTGQSNLIADGGTYNPALSASNLHNSYGLVSWLHVPLKYERDFTTAQLDFSVDGETPIALPGGNINVAFGGQYRYQKDLFTLDNLANQAAYGCTTGVNCLWSAGPLVGQRAAANFGVATETKREYPAWAAFGEAQLPILDNLTADLAIRYEKFIADTSNINNSALAPQASLKWQATDALALRAVAGSTFANVTPPEDKPPVTLATNALGAFQIGNAATSYSTVNTPNFLVSPETGFNYNVGAIFDKGPFSLAVDYYNIKIDNLARTLSVTSVLNGIAMPGSASVSGALINCSSPLLTQAQPALGGAKFVTLPSACVQGTTTFATAFNNAGPGGPAVVRFFGQPRNINAGDFWSDGIDVQSSLTFDDVMDGRLVLSGDVTKVLDWHMGNYDLFGISVSPAYDGVGSFNDSTAKADGGIVFEYRANGGVNYTHGRHNFNWRTVYTSSINTDLGTTLKTPGTATNANLPNTATAGVVDPNAAGCATAPTVGSPNLTNSENGVIPGAGQGQWGEFLTNQIGFCAANNVSLTGGTTSLPASWNSDFTYRLTLPGDAAFTATVQNVFDRDPGFTRTSDAYSSFLESPLGRTFRVGLEKKF